MKQGTDPLEAGLRGLFPEPEESFLYALEAELVTRAAARNGVRVEKRWVERLHSLFRRRAIALAVAIALLVMVAAFAARPEAVLAQIRALLSYVPGIGFTDAQQALVLPVPVVQTRDGVTLYVDQVLSETDRTVVMLNVEGLELEEQRLYLYNSFLRLPGGKALTQQGHRLEWDQATLIFGPLPEGVSQVELVWSDNLSRDWIQQPEQAWAIPLALEPARDADITRMASSYILEETHVSVEDMLVQITAVTQGTDQTAIHLRLLWPDETGRKPFYIGKGELTDDLSTSYEQVPSIPLDEQAQPIETVDLVEPVPGKYRGIRQTLVFEPGVPSASKLALTLSGVTIREKVDAEFILHLGSDLQVGDEFPLDVAFDAAGEPLHINGAHVVEADIFDMGGKAGKGLALEFTLDPLPEGAHRVVNWVNFHSPQVPLYLSFGYSLDPATGIHVLRLPLPEEATFSKIRVMGELTEAVLLEDFTISWDAPAR